MTKSIQALYARVAGAVLERIERLEDQKAERDYRQRARVSKAAPRIAKPAPVSSLKD